MGEYEILQEYFEKAVILLAFEGGRINEFDRLYPGQGFRDLNQHNLTGQLDLDSWNRLQQDQR